MDNPFTMVEETPSTQDATSSAASPSAPSTVPNAFDYLHVSEEFRWAAELTDGQAEALSTVAETLNNTLRDTLYSVQPYDYYGGYNYTTPTAWDGGPIREWHQRHVELIARRQAGELPLVHLKDLQRELQALPSNIRQVREHAFLARRVNEYRMKLHRALEHPKKWIYLPALRKATKEDRQLSEMWNSWALIGERRWRGFYSFQLSEAEALRFGQLRERFPISVGDRYTDVWTEWNNYLWRTSPRDYRPAFTNDPHPEHLLLQPRLATLRLMEALEKVTDE